MNVKPSAVKRGYAVYTKRSLAFYDWWVLNYSNRRLWQCPTDFLESHYRGHISDKHLEVGVGTGYFLEKTLPEGEPKVALLDANRSCLEFAAKRLEHYRPETYEENVLEPFYLFDEKYDSIGINYLLHCLPGRLEEKGAAVFDHLIPHLSEGGVIFGSTILGTEVERTRAAKFMMGFYNQKGVFSNKHDSLGGMMEALSSSFKTFNVEVYGCVVLFWGKSPKTEGEAED
tara:strand:+ start:192 stop:878 length:687 start_codon:yes stop_codon:yes gene_type:complete